MFCVIIASVIVMKIVKKYALFFVIGGVGYGLLELLWRGHTHWTMILAGGVCFIIFSLIAEHLYSLPLLIKAALSAVAVTAVELVFGLVFNLGLRLDVWDYTNRPLNFLGQICAPFSLLWFALGIVFVPIADVLNKRLEPCARP